MLKRKLYKELLAWKGSHTHTCLMVKGARQVGKTFTIREFGKKEYRSFIEINFIRQRELKGIFNGSLDARSIYKRMTAQIRDIELIPGETLIFLDEIQNCGNARTAIKFLAEDGRYDVISSGSLLGLTYAEEGDTEVEEPDSVPTGYEDFLTMYSLDFEEFLWAEGYDEKAIAVLRSYFESEEEIPKALNDQFEQLFREYIVIGGMPEVVAEYVKNHDFNVAARIQNRILEDYRFDISKHAKGAEKAKVRACYDAIPRQLAKELRKFQYSTVEKGKTSKKYGGSVRWLIDSALVHACYNVREPYLPLMANAVNEQFKLYINDTGLLCAIYGFETKRAILTNTIRGNAKGGIYENIIAESLVKKGYRIYYYKPDDSHELEFLIERNGGVVPIEVKAGNTATVSLNCFIKRYEPAEAYKLISGNIGISGEKKTLPHYMVMFL
ncbi:MAG: ATP-binding protein [Mogibacterium sp.]|nr:ATP-binding protein [Mogibacterium sp.]